MEYNYVQKLYLTDDYNSLSLNVTNTTNSENDCPSGMIPDPSGFDQCYLHNYDTLMHQIRGICEVTCVFWSIIYLGIAAREATFLPPAIFMQNMVLCPSRVIFLIGCVLLILTVPLRLTCQPDYENKLAILVMLFTGFYFLFFGR